MSGDEKRRPEGRRSQGHDAGQAQDRQENTTDLRQPRRVRWDGWFLYPTVRFDGRAAVRRVAVAYLVVWRNVLGWLEGYAMVPDWDRFHGDGDELMVAAHTLPRAPGTAYFEPRPISLCTCSKPAASLIDVGWCTDCAGVIPE